MDPVADKIKKISENDNISEAIEEASELLKSNPEDDRLLFLTGKLLWKSGQRDKAISYYLKADAINPDGPAKRALEFARDIDNFFNPDLLNP